MESQTDLYHQLFGLLKAILHVPSFFETRIHLKVVLSTNHVLGPTLIQIGVRFSKYSDSIHFTERPLCNIIDGQEEFVYYIWTLGKDGGHCEVTLKGCSTMSKISRLHAVIFH